jgi:hypothetical protein
MFKRPTVRRAYDKTHFVTETRANGTKVSYHTTLTRVRRVPTGTPGRVGEIADKLHAGNDAIRHATGRPWTPPLNYEFVASHMPSGQREAYIARCEEWHAANPQPERAAPKSTEHLKPEVLAQVFDKHQGQLPPLETRVAAYRAAGYTEDYVEYAKARAAKLEETADERQKALDLIFAKWPAASKTAPKKAKVIKAVKKRMTA